MKDTKIDWCDRTVNPVIGCKRGCPYCYAKRLNDRFNFVKDFAIPERKDSAFRIVKKGGISIFFDSMSDFDYWAGIDITNFHNTIMGSVASIAWIGLTKSPDAIDRFRSCNLGKDHDFFNGPNDSGCGLWLGYSIDAKAQVDKAMARTRPLDADFLSIEPIECDLFAETDIVDLMLSCHRKVKLAIIGAETGNRQGKVECKKEWVDSLVRLFDSCSIKVFMKSSLKTIMGKDFRQDELPWPVSEKKIKSRLARIKLRNGKETWCGTDDLRNFLGLETMKDYVGFIRLLHPRYSPEKIYVKIINLLSEKGDFGIFMGVRRYPNDKAWKRYELMSYLTKSQYEQFCNHEKITPFDICIGANYEVVNDYMEKEDPDE